MLRAYKYRIYPTDEQKVLFAKTFGCCRFVYNWALNLKIEAYRQEKRSVAYKEVQDRLVNELKKENQWLAEVNSQALLNSIRNLDIAYKNFFRDTHAVGFPRFKSRKNRQSFQCPQHCSIDFAKGTITIPKAILWSCHNVWSVILFLYSATLEGISPSCWKFMSDMVSYADICFSFSSLTSENWCKDKKTNRETRNKTETRNSLLCLFKSEFGKHRKIQTIA